MRPLTPQSVTLPTLPRIIIFYINRWLLNTILGVIDSGSRKAPTLLNTVREVIDSGSKKAPPLLNTVRGVIDSGSKRAPPLLNSPGL